MKNEIYWLIAYDICHKKRLAKVAKCISAYAWRLQNSVFEMHAGYSTIAQMKKRLETIIKEDDSVLIIPICKKDREKRKIYGLSGENPMSGNYLVL